jgi:DNA-binding YbaB/EbfC family protein
MKMGDINNMMKQAQQMQARMMEAQEKLAEEKVEGSAGGGLVKAVVTGQGALIEVKIDPEVIKPEEPEILEDLVLVAVNDGLEKSRELVNSRMTPITGPLVGPLGTLGLKF